MGDLEKYLQRLEEEKKKSKEPAITPEPSRDDSKRAEIEILKAELKRKGEEEEHLKKLRV